MIVNYFFNNTIEIKLQRNGLVGLTQLAKESYCRKEVTRSSPHRPRGTGGCVASASPIMGKKIYQVHYSL
jgi:hypothetical protein